MLCKQINCVKLLVEPFNDFLRVVGLRWMNTY